MGLLRAAGVAFKGYENDLGREFNLESATRELNSGMLGLNSLAF